MYIVLWKHPTDPCIVNTIRDSIPNDTKTLSDEEMESVQKLIDRIEEDEDVQNVFTNLA